MMKTFGWARILCATFLLATAGYMVAVAPSLPERLPLQWNARNEPTWFGSRGLFFAFNALGVAISAGVGLLIPRPEARWIGAASSAGLLVVFHAQVQQVLRPPTLYVSINAAVGVLVALLAAAFAGVAIARKGRSHPRVAP